MSVFSPWRRGFASGLSFSPRASYTISVPSKYRFHSNSNLLSFRTGTFAIACCQWVSLRTYLNELENRLLCPSLWLGKSRIVSQMRSTLRHQSDKVWILSDRKIYFWFHPSRFIPITPNIECGHRYRRNSLFQIVGQCVGEFLVGITRQIRHQHLVKIPDIGTFWNREIVHGKPCRSKFVRCRSIHLLDCVGAVYGSRTSHFVLGKSCQTMCNVHTWSQQNCSVKRTARTQLSHVSVVNHDVKGNTW